ncbi:arginyltransferase [Hahella sp. SMD15-11]|uniref:Aspartate/glutamate leucyltransferase n=1 Tax=Thermohahella caldifontis TaxID=3142973 RepID=A0AB39UY70_9GAMM
MSNLKTLVFYATPEHDCSYLPGRQAVTLFVDPSMPINDTLYTRLSQIGFRRSGQHYYRPKCAGCQACIPVRIPVWDFDMRRRHRRVLRANAHLRVTEKPVDFYPEHFDLYCRYINARHADGDMYPPSREQYDSFLLDARPGSYLNEFREGDTVVCVSVVDRLLDGLSAIYTFFSPDMPHNSLGTLAILTQIDQCRRFSLPYLYLGYWIRNSRKMQYKNQFSPLEYYLDQQWVRA